MTERIALGLSYSGGRYYGWQRQTDTLTVQTEVETALSKMSGEAIACVPAGRTDRGVHALNQVVHFDTHKMRAEEIWQRGLNAHLPLDIRVQWVKKVQPDFHARFSATERHYRYLILNQPVSSPILQDFVTWYPYKLDCEKMQQGALYLIGEHDFSAFRDAHCQSKSPIRKMKEILISQQDDLIQFDVRANAFLHHMVRNIVGTLLMVGRQKQSPEWVKSVLAAKDRRQAGITAPARGLYFYDVTYDDIHALPTKTSQSLLLPSNILGNLAKERFMS